MATEALERIRNEVLELTETERAELAHDLIASLDAPGECGVENAWDREILQRISLMNSGQVKLLDREAFRKKIRSRDNGQ